MKGTIYFSNNREAMRIDGVLKTFKIEGNWLHILNIYEYNQEIYFQTYPIQEISVIVYKN